MKSIKKLLSIMLVFAMLISAVPSQALAYYNERNGFDFYQYDDSYVAPTFLPDNENAKGENEFCQWTYDAQTSTVYIDGETIESSENAYYHTRYIMYNGYECYDQPSAMLSLYNLVEEDGVTIEQYCPLNFKHLIIGKNVKNFNSHISYEYYDSLESLTFEEGSNLQSVGKQAFYKFPLESIELPSTVTKIGEGVFEQSNIIEYDIPSSIKYIPNNMFYRSKLERVTLHDSITQIGDYAFSKTNITELKIPDSVKSFGSYIASETLISECEFPSSLTFVPREFFAGCKNVNSIDFLSNNIKEIWEGAFRGTSITSLDFTKTNITVIDEYAFSSCKNLESVKFNANTTKLAGFGNCEKLTKIDFPSKLVEIGANAFTNDENLVFSSIPDTVEIINDNAFAKSGITEAVLNTTSTKAKVGMAAFAECKKLEKVVLPKSITSIGWRCFYNSSIRAIEIPDSVKSIGQYAFYGTPLEEVKVGKNASLQNIEPYAFSNCSNLTSFTFPKNMNLVKDYAFYNDVNLKYIIAYGYIQPYDKAFSLAEDEAKLSITRIYGDEEIGPKWYAEKHNIEFVPLSDLTDYPDTSDVSSTNKGTWANGSWVYDESTERFLVNGTGKLTSSFKYSNGISVNITKFLASKDLSSIVICDGITEIADDVFFAADGITTNNVSLPSTLTKIGASSFRNIKANKVRINGDIQSIGANAFYGSTIKTIDLSNCSLISISNYAFANCSNLTEVKLPNTVTEICEGAFYNTGLTALTLDENIQTIGKKAFANCQSLSEVVVKNKDVSIYSDSNKSNNAFGFDDSGNALQFKYKNIPYNLVINAPIGANAFKYAENNGLTVMSDKENATVSGYIKEATPIKWHYFRDTKTLYVEGYNNLASAIVGSISTGGDGYLRYENGEIATDLDVDLLYVCSGVKNVNAKFESINPKYIHVPNTATTIGYNTFKNCSNLSVASIPNSVIYIQNSAFENCRNLVRCDIPSSVTDIGNSAFKNCTSLKAIDLNSVKNIKSQAFNTCSALEEIVIPKTVEEIGSEAFYNCLNVKKITINSDCRIGSKAFGNMPFCTTVVLNTERENNSWHDCFFHLGFSTTGIEIVIGDDVVNVNFEGFRNIFNQSKTKITSIHFGKSVVNVDNLPDPRFIEELTVSSENKHLYTYEGNVYYDTRLVLANPNIHKVIIKDGTTVIDDAAFWDSIVMQISLPDSVTEIGAYAFYNCQNLKRVNVDDKLRKVGDSAFENCYSLYSFEFPSLANTIGNSCFKNCYSLQSVILPNWITKIEPYTFYGCESLNNVVVPKLVNTIGEYAFAGCNLETIFVWKVTSTISATWLGFSIPNTVIHTIAGSKAAQFASEHNMECRTYASTISFGEVCDAQLEEDGQYVDICQDGHGEIEYLTVYEPDCEYDGYIIGVCEFCSEILEEIHKEATGHNYVVTAEIAPTNTTKGVKRYTCKTCSKTFTEYTDKLSADETKETHKVTATVVLDNNGKIKNYTPIRNADVVIDGEVVAKTDDNGGFTLELETGSYTADIKYSYGFTRTIGIVVENKDINYEEQITIVGVDYNKDGKVDENDLEMFSMVMSSSKDDLKYLDYADLNNDGYINAKDYVIIRSFIGTSADTYEYPLVTITK